MAEVRKAFGSGFLPELEKLVKSAPDYEKRFAGWRELNKNWIAQAGGNQKTEVGQSNG